MQQSQYEEAADGLKNLGQNSCDPRTSLLLAAALEGEGNLESAETILEQSLKTWPTNNSIAASLAREYFTDKQVEKAVAALQHFQPTPTTPLQELELAAVVDISGHQLTAAEVAAEQAYKSYPSIGTILLLANSLQLQGRFKDVVALLNSKRDAYSSSAPFFITLAESEYDSVLYDTACTDLQRAIALNGQSYQAHLLLGNVWTKLGETDKALKEYRLSIEQSPRQPRSHYQLALALEAAHDQDGAKNELTEALEIDNAYAPAHFELGRLLMNENQVSEAISHLNHAVQENPNSEQAYFLLAKAYSQTGDKDKSQEMARRLEEVRNANARATAGKN